MLGFNGVYFRLIFTEFFVKSILDSYTIIILEQSFSRDFKTVFV